MRKSGFWIVGTACVAAGLYYGLFIYPVQRFRTELDQALRQLPPEYSVSYKEANYALLSGNVSVRGIAFHRAAPHGIDVTVDELDLTKPSHEFAAEWSKAAANPSALDHDMALPVAAAISLKGVGIRTADTSGTFEAAEVETLRLSPWVLLHSDVPSVLEAEAALLTQTKPVQLIDILPLLRAESAFLLGIDYGRYELVKLNTTGKMPATPTLASYDFSYGIKKMTGAGFHRGLISEGAIEGMTMQGGPMGTVTLDKLVIADLNLQKPLTQLLEGRKPSISMLDGVSIGRLEYDGMAFQSPTAGPIAFDSFGLSNIRFSQGMPVSAEVSFNGFHMSKAQIPNSPAVAGFAMLGLDTATVSFGFGYKWDLDQKQIAIHDTFFKVDELGALTLTAEISNATPGVSWQSQARLTHATMRYTDASLTERAFRARAAMTGADPLVLRNQLIGAVQQQGAVLGDDPLAASKKAIAVFLADPHVLTVELAPPTPILLATITAKTISQAELIPTLGLSIAATQ